MKEDNVIYFKRTQGDLIGLTKAIHEAAKDDEIQCLFITAIDNKGSLKTGRAGGFKNLQDFLLLLGGFDVNKDYIIQKMLAIEEAGLVDDDNYDEDEEYEEE